ncbi:MAG TPA: FAD-linked oxidase C-terminal domain-containing protein [Chloroflexota bacterium]|nr:FAD-linked oxidase C-terminal domain-containing protein [Chloroflexota bacterium]
MKDKLDAATLAAELSSAIEGEVRFNDGDRALYATDGSNYRHVPVGVVVPRSAEDVVKGMAVVRRHQAPMLSRGGGTSLSGETTNKAVVFDFSKYMNHILELDPQGEFARVEPGVVLDHLRKKAEEHHLTFGPDPSTHQYCTLGGMIGNNSCGVHSVMAGRTAENVQELEILTYDGLRMWVGPTSDQELEQIIAAGGRRGEIYRRLRELRDRYGDEVRARFPKIPRRVSGYNLDELLPENGFNVAKALVGSEGTCITVLQAKLRLVPSPPARSLVAAGFPDIFQAGDHAGEIRYKFHPLALEGVDRLLIDGMKKKHLHPQDLQLLPEADSHGWLMIEFGGDTKEESDAKANELIAWLKKEKGCEQLKLFDDPHEEKLIWEVRESGLGATAQVPGEPDTWEGWEDSAVPPEHVGNYLRELNKLYKKYDYFGALYGHFGDGCIHTRIDFDLRSSEGIKKYRAFMEEASDLVLSFGGSLSGEHGDGQSRAELLPKMFGPDLVHAFEEFKAIWDPDWKMNPGRVVKPHRIDEDLRLGVNYNPWNPQTHFQFPEDSFSFAKAALRCVGVGKCRKDEEGTMCPSYQVTKEEKHSTRGRAHLLWELTKGEVIQGWRNSAVKEALDLCLACKGCKGECPINVDMATYKAEFLSHYYAGRLRPRQAYAMGLIYWWARLASLAPGAANVFGHTPVLSTLFKWAGGIAPQREVPAFAPQTFRQWWKERGGSRPGGHIGRVVLWPDTFNNHFFPETAIAAVEVLEAAGYEVSIPEKSLCCGRPLYDYGMLPTAKRLLLDVLSALQSDIRAGVSVVGLEPSCVSVFRDEMLNLFPHNADAQKLAKQVFLLDEFLGKQAKDYDPPRLHRKAIVHGHCHHKSVLGFGSSQKLLEKMGLDLEVLDSGCCGMAGSFGFEAGEKYEVSQMCGERKLLPKVRETPPDALLVADGFSCREQIEMGTHRRALHTAQVLQMAMKDGSSGPAGPLPEREYVPSNQDRALATGLRRWQAIAAASAAALGLAGVAAALRRRS